MEPKTTSGKAGALRLSLRGLVAPCQPLRVCAVATIARRPDGLLVKLRKAAACLKGEDAQLDQAPGRETVTRSAPDSSTAPADAPHSVPQVALAALPQHTAYLAAFQAACLNVCLGLAAYPVVVFALGETNGLAPGSDTSSASAVVLALLLGSTAQAGGTSWLVRSELEARAPGSTAASSGGLLASVGCRLSARSTAQGVALAAVAAAAVAATSVAMAALGPADPSAGGVTEALGDALKGASVGAADTGAGVSSLGVGSSGASQGSVADMRAAQAVSLLCSEALLAPAAEELVFRGLLLGPQLRALSVNAGSASGRSAGQVPWRAAAGPVVQQAALFALYHLSAAEWPMQFVLGLVLGAGYVASRGNLAVSWIAHGVYNAAALALVLRSAL